MYRVWLWIMVVLLLAPLAGLRLYAVDGEWDGFPTQDLSVAVSMGIAALASAWMTWECWRILPRIPHFPYRMLPVEPRQLRLLVIAASFTLFAGLYAAWMGSRASEAVALWQRGEWPPPAEEAPDWDPTPWERPRRDQS